MNVEQLSTNGLVMLYAAVRDALEVDDNAPEGQAKTYGVRELPDWRRWADSLEHELDRRNAKYIKIRW
jgi:hypothetical protein